MELSAYLQMMEGGIYKILPLWEEQQSGGNVHLDVYIPTLVDELIGAQRSFPELGRDPSYIAIINTVQYMIDHEMTHAECRRKVFRMLRLLNQMEGDAHV